jgi:hypothetical protein
VLAVCTVVGALLAGSMSAASATKPSRGCDNDSWQTTVFPRDWQPGEDFDLNGLNTLHEATLAGLIEDFGSLDAAIEALGLGDLDGIAAAELSGDLKYDKNMDGILCWKPFRGSSDVQPSYYFNVVDNTANH